MASSSSARKGGVSLPERRSLKKDDVEGACGVGILTKISQSGTVTKAKQYSSDTWQVMNKLAHHTSKAAWIFGNSFLILVVPLIIEMDREQQLSEMELQHTNILGVK